MRHFEHPRYEWLNQRMYPILMDVLSRDYELAEPHLSNLSNSDQCAFYIGVLMWQVGNGGVHEYVSGPYAEHIDFAIHYLYEVGSIAVGDSLSQLKECLPKGYLPLAREARDNELFKVCDNEGVELLDDLVPIDVNSIDLDSVYFYCTKEDDLG